MTPPLPPHPHSTLSSPGRRHRWFKIAIAVALIISGGGIWQHAEEEKRTQERQAKAAAYKGRSGAALRLDGVNADVTAHWSRHADSVVVELRSYFDSNACYLHIASSGESESHVRKNGWHPDSPKIELPVKDPLADVTVRIEIGGRKWKRNSPATSKTVRLSPTGTAYDAENGNELPPDI